MADNMNIELNDDMMAEAAGGSNEMLGYRVGVVKCTWKTNAYLVTVKKSDGNIEDLVALYDSVKKINPGTTVKIALIPGSGNWRIIAFL